MFINLYDVLVAEPLFPTLLYPPVMTLLTSSFPLPLPLPIPGELDH